VTERLASEGDKPKLSISGGVAVFPRDGDSPTMLLRAADHALYGSKTEKKSSKRAAPPADELKTGTLF
jgi:GGDEF domain-containing protein